MKKDHVEVPKLSNAPVDDKMNQQQAELIEK